MSYDPQKINVVVSGATSTQIVTPTSNTINVSQQSASSSVNTTATTSTIQTTGGVNVSNIGFLGVQGPAGNITGFNSPLGTPDNSIFFNNDGQLSGINGFFYYPSSDNLEISGKNLIKNSGSFVFSGMNSEENAFLLRDAADKNLFKIDTQNKRLVLSENVGSSEYYIGVGEDDPQERLHISNGNLRVDGNMMISGHILPLRSGEFDLGSPSFPFKDLYLQGNSIVFVDKDAKITADSNGFTFQVTGSDGQYKTLFEAKEETVGTFVGDGTSLTGVPYSGIQDAGAFIQQSIPSGSEFVTVNYGKTLNYDPSVICSVSSPISNNNVYFATVDTISRTGCRALFSENISGDDFVLNCHISPINPVF